MRTVGIDLETTGLNNGLNIEKNEIPHEICEITVIEYGENFKLGEKFVTLVRPNRFENIDPRAMEINGIDIEELKKAPTSMQVKNALIEWASAVFTDEKMEPLGFNYKFDEGFLIAFLGKKLYYSLFHYKYEDVHQNFRLMQKAGYFPEIKSTKLTNICQELDIPHKAHDAEGDVWATLQLQKIITDGLARANLTFRNHL